MKTVGFQGDFVISWHRGKEVHPIFDPEYARENLVSLGQTLVMLYFYLAIFTLTLHYLVTLGVIEYQTIPWMLIEGATRNFLGYLPQSLVNNRLSIFVALITTIIAAQVTWRSFELIKADLHPKRKHSKKKVV